MKKGFKFVLGLGLVASLASCSGSVISVETAKERAQGIIDYQSEHASEIGKEGFAVNMSMKISDGNETADVKLEYYVDAENDIQRVKGDIKTSSSGSNTEIHSDIYVGKIDGKNHYVNMTNKTYSTTNTSDLMELRGYLTQLVSVVSSATGMLTMIDWESEDASKLVFRSKGEGHLYIAENALMKEENHVTTSKSNVEFENYQVKSYYSSMTEKYTYDGNEETITINVKLNAKWSCKLSMPSIKGFKQK